LATKKAKNGPGGAAGAAGNFVFISAFALLSSFQPIGRPATGISGFYPGNPPAYSP
jgi:hypothetical protein